MGDHVRAAWFVLGNCVGLVVDFVFSDGNWRYVGRGSLSFVQYSVHGWVVGPAAELTRHVVVVIHWLHSPMNKCSPRRNINRSGHTPA